MPPRQSVRQDITLTSNNPKFKLYFNPQIMKSSLKLFAFSTGLLALGCISQGCSPSGASGSIPAEVTLTKTELMNKIKGGWAGQTIGCSYGSVTEFRYRGTMIQDYVPVKWEKNYIKHFFDTWPELYDDVYMDLTFVDVIDRLGIDAPVDSFAMAFATAGYHLWHANQAARYNILNGIMPPASGHWINNPHADDIDYQIEADFAGLMSPGMPNTASEISDRVGHIMNYGEGWYGGVYVGAMYSLAFISDDIEFIVTEALKTIPAESRYHRCMSDVIKWHRQYPDDWKQTWFECERKYSAEIGCPEGVFAPLNIDATINSAYVLIGLLYGEGDFARTIDISTRCGQDSDCNPATAAGILGTIIGYDSIPQRFMPDLHEVEDLNFAYTDISLNKTYGMSFNHALQNIERNGGRVTSDEVVIKCQKPTPVRYEENFSGIYPVDKREINRRITDLGELEFDGTGFVLRGEVHCPDNSYVAEVELYIDDKPFETVLLPASYTTRRFELLWNYQLPKGHHKIRLNWLNPVDNANIHAGDFLVYSDKPEQ